MEEIISKNSHAPEVVRKSLLELEEEALNLGFKQGIPRYPKKGESASTESTRGFYDRFKNWMKKFKYFTEELKQKQQNLKN